MHFKAEFFTKFKTSWIIFRYLFCLSVMPISINYIHSVFLLLFLSHFPTLFPSFAILRANHMPQFLVFVFVHTVIQCHGNYFLSLSFSPNLFLSLMLHFPLSYLPSFSPSSSLSLEINFTLSTLFFFNPPSSSPSSPWNQHSPWLFFSFYQPYFPASWPEIGFPKLPAKIVLAWLENKGFPFQIMKFGGDCAIN